MTKLLRVKEVAEMLHISRGSVYLMVSKGKLAPIRPTGRRGKIFIHADDVDKLLRSCRVASITELKRGIA